MVADVAMRQEYKLLKHFSSEPRTHAKHNLLAVSDIPGQSGSPAVVPGVFSQLPGSCLIGVSHFPYSETHIPGKLNIDLTS